MIDSEDDGYLYEAYQKNYLRYADEINKKITKDLITGEKSEKHGLAAYIDEDKLAKKIYSIYPKVEVRNGNMYGTAVVRYYGALDKAELSILKEYISGQFSDGWGESFEQHPVTLGSDKVYISFWNSGDDYFLKSESEVFPEQNFEQTMGGIT